MLSHMSTNTEERIAQWEQMAREAPDDMAFFSLGSAYKDAERLDDAQGAFAKAIELNPGMSRAYQLRGQVLIQIGRDGEAGPILTQGYTVAAERGDVMPQKAIGSLLEKLNYLFRCRHISARSTTKGFAQSAGNNIDLTKTIEMLGRAAASFA